MKCCVIAGRPNEWLLPLSWIAFCLLGCALGSPDAGEACEIDAPEAQQCDAPAECVGGFCTGGSCPCERGWECRREDGFIFDNEYCALPCTGHSDCPDTWGCLDDYCGFPRPIEFQIEGPLTATLDTPVTFTADVTSSAGEPSFEWRVDSTDVDPATLDASAVTVVYSGDARETVVSLTVSDEHQMFPVTETITVELR